MAADISNIRAFTDDINVFKETVVATIDSKSQQSLDELLDLKDKVYKFENRLDESLTNSEKNFN